MPLYLSGTAKFMNTVAHYIVGNVQGQERATLDFYPTPRRAIDALLSVEKFEGVVLEPACGEGHISEVLIAAGLDVQSADLTDYGYGVSGVDFLFFPVPKSVDHVITNPPYDQALEFVETALLVARYKVAMLLKLTWLEGITRQEFFRNSPLKTVYVFSRRLRMSRNGVEAGHNGMITFAWFVWEHGYQDAPTIGWL